MSDVINIIPSKDISFKTKSLLKDILDRLELSERDRIDLQRYIEFGGGDSTSPIGIGNTNNSAVLKGEFEGYSNKALSQTSMAIGAATTAGLKGWYYSNIDFANKKITLSDRPTYILAGNLLLNGGWSSGVPNIKVGDVISLVNDSKYDFCSKVTAISDNVITVDSLPFIELVRDNGAAVAVIAGQFSDGYSLYIPERPDAGIIDFGGGAFSEGGQSMATNICAHAEGLQTHAYGQYSHSEGRQTKAGYAAHAEGLGTEAKGLYSHAEGTGSKAIADGSHVEGYETQAEGKYAHSEGRTTKAIGTNSHAEGQNSEARKNNSHAEGQATIADGDASHSEGRESNASGIYSHAEGRQTTASNNNAHAEGQGSIANGHTSHAEGWKCIAGTSDTEPTINTNTDDGNYSHAEGNATWAKGNSSHAEGRKTKAFGKYSHAEGLQTSAYGESSHVEGFGCVASGVNSHAEGHETRTYNRGEHACGMYNDSIKAIDASKGTIFTIGIGTSAIFKNAIEVKANGDVYIIGIGGYDGTNSDSAQTLQEILANIQ